MITSATILRLRDTLHEAAPRPGFVDRLILERNVIPGKATLLHAHGMRQELDEAALILVGQGYEVMRDTHPEFTAEAMLVITVPDETLTEGQAYADALLGIRATLADARRADDGGAILPDDTLRPQSPRPLWW